MTTEEISILIADDHQVVRHGMRLFLETQPGFHVAGEAADGKQAAELAAELAPDVALLDLNMPVVDGIEATRRIRQVSPHTQVVVLTSYHADEHIFPALRAGAISYLLKDIPMDELAQAIRRAARGEATLNTLVAARVLQELRGPRADTPNPFTELTDREMDILRLLANGLSNSKIAAQLVITENTVKGHVSNILGKLHLSDRTQAAIYAWREGVVHRNEPGGK
jgi:two-component system, NarL family, response regulator LiaR